MCLLLMQLKPSVSALSKALREEPCCLCITSERRSPQIGMRGAEGSSPRPGLRLASFASVLVQLHSDTTATVAAVSSPGFRSCLGQ